MHRRHSLQSPPEPPGPPSSGGPVFDPKDETSQGARNNAGRKRSSSVTGFLTKLLPSHRPERSGTLRDQGFWEQQQSDRPVPDKRPGPDHKHGSDSIVSSGWNPAVELPRRTQTARERRLERHMPLRERSQPIGNRPESATPLHRQLGEGVRQQDRQPLNANNDTRTRIEVVTSTVSRLPVDPGRQTEDGSQRLVTAFDAKREARRLRRSLKESRDFLGVQGVNPHTGVMDVLTPTSSSPTDRTMMSAPEAKAHSESMSELRAGYPRAPRTGDAEEASLERLGKEQEQLDKTQRKKVSIRALHQRVRWRKDTNQWSSVAEPDLSPIADASTRSRTPRSTSDGAILPPVAIQRVLRPQETRSVSNPAPPQTVASAPESRPGIVTQDSSDTVIHTPHPDGKRRFSLATHILGRGFEGSSPEAARRASDPAPGVWAGSPGSSTSDRGISRKPVPPPKDRQRPPPLRLTIPGGVEQHPPLEPVTHQDSFLGIRIEPDGARHGRIRDHGAESPSTPPLRTENEETTPPNMDRTPTVSPPNVAVRDFARERRGKVWFGNHQSSPDSPPTKSPSGDQRRDITEAPATSSQSQQRTLHVYRTPLIPLRMNPSHKDTNIMPESGVKEHPIDLVDVEIPPETVDSPSDGWAKKLLDDFASCGQGAENLPPTAGDRRESSPRAELVETRRESISAAEETPREPPISAFIPITTITGYDPRLLMHTRGLYKRPHSGGPPAGIACKDDRMIRILATEAATKLQVERSRARGGDDRQQTDDRVTRISTTEIASGDSKAKAEVKAETGRPAPKTTSTSVQQPTQPTFDLLASPPRLPQNVWPSLDIPAPHQRQHRMPQRPERRGSSGRTTTKTVAYGTGPGPASGTTSSPRRPHSYAGVGLSVPAKTALIYAAAQEPPAPILPTTSAPQLTATRERCGTLYRRGSRPHPPKLSDSGATMTPAIGPYINGTSRTATPAQNTNTTPYRRPAATAASLTYTSTYHATVPKYRNMPRLTPPSSSNSSPNHTPNPRSRKSSPRRPEPSRNTDTPRKPATEAARAALLGTQCRDAATRTGPLASRKRDKTTNSSASTAAASGPAGGADTDGRSGGVCDGSDGVRRIAVYDPHASRLEKSGGSQAGTGVPELLLRALVAYWGVVAPVFDAGSPVSKRFAAGTSTWRDCVVYLLALAFVLGALLGAVWSVKGVLLIAGLGRAVARCGLVLVGF